MFFSSEMIKQAIENLKHIHPFYGITFLVCKKYKLPVNETTNISINNEEKLFLEKYYKPYPNTKHFFRVFRPSDANKYWLSYDYPSSGLQSTRTREFKDAFIHITGTNVWGWQYHYVSILKYNLIRNKKPYYAKSVPAFYLAIWLYRNNEWPSETTPQEVINMFLQDFYITKGEQENLFDISVPHFGDIPLFSNNVISVGQLESITGKPPDALPDEGATLHQLELQEIGPATFFQYNPAKRLNIITGDNSLGKTFILECIWWVLTSEWLEYPILPRKNKPKNSPKINFTIDTTSGRLQKVSCDYNWDKQSWRTITKREAIPGLVIYARFDGSFAVWDPVRKSSTVSKSDDPKALIQLFFSRQQLWDGLPQSDMYQKQLWLCNGLIRDWVTWQTGGDRYKIYYDSLIACLKVLSPSEDEHILPGEPARLSINDVRDFPTIKMPYGDVPVINASAGVQRIIGLAYILVWAWQEHLKNSSVVRKQPQPNLIFLIDEVEAHLHPKWQRSIVPALMEVVKQLSSSVNLQIHLATHSPLVMASAETVFDQQMDDLHHLKLIGQEVVLEKLPFVKRGKVDLWLMSDVFGLKHARSLLAEKAIEEAKKLQLEDEPNSKAINEVNTQLIKHLAPDDDFWPRWRFFAKQHGLKK